MKNNIKIMAIGFFGNSKTQLNALKASGWCDSYYLPPNKTTGGIPGTVDELKKLSLEYKKYNAALIFQDTLFPASKYFYDQCVKYNITIYANQHGFNKSILQIKDFTPNIYSKYWNCMGKYFLDRFKEVTEKDAISQRWISMGSLLHDYLYKNYTWKKENNNGKALIIHEPDLKVCEGDPYPHKSEENTRLIIEALKKENIKADMKPHPNWKNFIGNTGKILDKPKGIKLVDINVEDIVNYALVIGSRSTMLLDAVAMGIPTIALQSSSSWKDDKYPPVEEGLIPTFSKKRFSEGLKKCFNNKPKYNQSFRDYFLGPLGKVADNYYDFIKKDQNDSSKILGKYYYIWQGGLSAYIKKDNSKVVKILKQIRKLMQKIIKKILREMIVIYTHYTYKPNTLSFQKKHWKNSFLRYDFNNKKLYGYDWGDPNKNATKEKNGKILGNYKKIKDDYLLPYLNKHCNILEIGSCGGKWTQFMLKANKIFCVDLNNEFFEYIKKKLPSTKIRFYKTSGNELKGIKDNSINLIFSMDTFVRIPKKFIFDYFKEFSRILKTNGKACIHLPCDDIPGSKERKFVNLSRKDIKKLCIDNEFKNFDIDDKVIKHGIILRIN